MTREKAIKIVKEFINGTCLHLVDQEAFETLIPELNESEDERMREEIKEFIFKQADRGDLIAKRKKWIAYLEKQKEQPKEELVYRLNSLMQDYIKEGKDEEEKKHRFKCYKLFWDALEDGGFFEQKEQKPADNISKEEYVKRFKALCDAYEFKLPNREYDIYHLCDDLSKLSIDSGKQKSPEWSYPYGRNETADRLVSLAECLEMDGDCLFNGYSGTECGKFLRELARKQIGCKPSEWSEEDKRKLNSIYVILGHAADDKGFLTSKRIIGDKEAIELQDFLKSLPERFNLQPKVEWSEKDEDMLDSIVNVLEVMPSANFIPIKREIMIPWLKSLPERFNLQTQQEWSEDNIKELTKFEVAMLHIGMSFFGSSAGLNPNNTNEVKKQAKLLLELVPKQDWSEEDEDMRKKAIEYITLYSDEYGDYNEIKKVLDWFKFLLPHPHLKPSEEQKYDGNMDKECIKLCDILNSVPSIDTFESCCGHLKDRYSIWFFCNDIITISRLGRCVERNYSDGKWELLVDSTDTHPTGVFWLRSKVPFQSYDEMEKSVNELCNNIQYWGCSLSEIVKKEVKQELH